MSKFRGNKARNQQPDKQVAETPAETTSAVENKTEEVVPANNFAEAAAKVEAAGGETVPPVEAVTTNKRGVIPDQFGNNVKGERICSVCGIKESETLAKNPRYSFCKGKCVNCYGKTERKTTKPESMTVEQIETKIKYYTDLLAKKVGAQGRVEGNAIENAADSTVEASIESHGANVDSEADVLAKIS